jgi:hypothetical protein
MKTKRGMAMKISLVMVLKVVLKTRYREFGPIKMRANTMAVPNKQKAMGNPRAIKNKKKRKITSVTRPISIGFKSPSTWLY